MSESTIEQYNRKASRYERCWKKYLDHTHSALLDRIDINASDFILDVSGGTGLFVEHIIEHSYSFDQIIINDPSEKMLAVARRRFADNDKVGFGNDKADQLSYEQNSIDKIICLNAFHFYQNQQQVLERFYQILKPGGALYILDWNREGLFRVVNALIQWTQSEHIETRSLKELQQMLAGGDFDIRKTDSWSWRYWKLMFVEAYKA